MKASSSPPPVFVTGYMRSGTTLLGNIIDRHPSVAVFIESFFIPSYYFTQILYWPLWRDKNYLRLARSIVEEPASQRNGLVLDEASLLSDRNRSLASLIDRLFGDWARTRDKRRWADKSPGYISKFVLLDRMFPDARFIHIVRDGRDVWLSVKKLGWQSDVVRVAADWSSTVSKARAYGASLAPDRYLEVQYERLVQAPEQEARRIASFLGESYDPMMTEPDPDGPGNPALAGWPKVDEKIDAANTQKWKTQLNTDELAAFDVCARSLLESLGYEVPSDAHYSPVKRLSIRLRQYAGTAWRPFQLLGKTVRFFARAMVRRFR